MQKQQLVTDIKQSLRLTAALTQSIKVLQMSSVELSAYVNAELENNPFLENGLPLDEEDIEDEYQVSYIKKGGGESEYNAEDFLSNISAQKSLKEHVIEQISTLHLSGTERLIAFHLADSLDSNGYIKCNISDVAKILNCDLEIIENCLLLLQEQIDPAGVFARNLSECIKLQISDGDIDKEHLGIVADNLHLVGKNEVAKLAKLCGTSKTAIIGIIHKIKELNPKPGLKFNSDNVQYKVPDIFLYYNKDGNLKLELNMALMPKLSLNKSLYANSQSSARQSEDKKYVKTEMVRAENLVSAVERRADTILKVAGYIVEKQRDFFKRGILYFKPLILRDIALLCEMNESTISRAIANKYISTPFGVYELKYFFSSSLTNNSGQEDVSSIKVKELIKSIIDCESQDDILSDDDIVAELKNFNINIARRTVAKYREAIKIPTSAERKRQARVQ